jgi:hypothetical protein
VPNNYTPVKIISSGLITNYSDNIYTIPTGKILKLQKITASAADDDNVVELYYDPSGNGSNMIIIDYIYVIGTSIQHDLNESYIGDGIKSIRLRRRRVSGGSSEIFAKWEGYY